MIASQRPKRFYKHATTAPVQGGFEVQLDGRGIKTPARASLCLPSSALAQTIADEWNAQGAAIDLPSMTLTRLANVAIDRTPHTRPELISEIVNYAGTDLTCFLANEPQALQARQDAGWRPWRDWAETRLGVRLLATVSVAPPPQPEASLNAVRTHVERFDDYRLTAMVWACSLLGSAVLALAVEQGAITASEAFSLSCIDEDWQIEHWGEEDEARHARAGRERDAEALGKWFTALRA